MDHSEALRTKAAERYLLGELLGEPREEFEEHIFSCLECAEDIRMGAVFIENARKELAGVAGAGTVQAEAKEWWSGWLRPAFAVPVFALLLLIIGYQNAVVIPQLKSAGSAATTPQALRNFSLLTSNSRGDGALNISVAPNQPFGIFLDIPPQGHFDSYVCEFENESGATELSIPVTAEQAKETVQLLIPARRLGQGNHVLVVRGVASSEAAAANKTEVARYPFRLESFQ
ncbi:MAG TPA: zf-HC2 domain-containing protein [Candidatus Sulfotelmatobacter sp.]|nr:zf-HC2 domain-containing protein [Candidatus Sulfotelmatobacter sp.]